MLDKVREKADASTRKREIPQRRQASGIIDLLGLDLGSVRSHKLLILAVMMFFAACGLIYLEMRTPKFTAGSLLVVDHRLLQAIQKDAIYTAPTQAGSVIQTEIEILKSQKIAKDAVERLRSPEFEAKLTAPDISDLARAKFWPGNASTLPQLQNDEERSRALVDRVHSRLQVVRVPGTSIIEVRATAPDPTAAAAISNAISRAYLDDQAEANSNIARTASAWLRDLVKSSGTVARVLAEATPPRQPDGPKPLVVMAAALVAGLSVGGVAALGREHLFRRVRTTKDAAGVAQAECFGVLPALRSEPKSAGSGPLPDPTTRTLGAFPPPYDWEHSPTSTFARTIQRIGVAATLEQPEISTLGVTSCFVGEGKTTVALNLARVTAAAGHRILLVDSGPGGELSAQLLQSASSGLAEVLRCEKSLDKVRWTDPVTGMHFLPAGLATKQDSTFGRSSLLPVLDLCKDYDLVIFDLPAVSVAAHEVRAAAVRLDTLLLVLEYGRAPANTFQRCLDYVAPAVDRYFGVVLNKVDRKGLKYYAAAGEPHAGGSRRTDVART